MMWYFWRGVCSCTLHIRMMCDKVGPYAVKRCNRIALGQDAVKGTGGVLRKRR